MGWMWGRGGAAGSPEHRNRQWVLCGWGIGLQRRRGATLRAGRSGPLTCCARRWRPWVAPWSPTCRCRRVDLREVRVLATRCQEGGGRTEWALVGRGAPLGLTIHALPRGLGQGGRGCLLQQRVQQPGVRPAALGAQVSGAELEQTLPQLPAHLSHLCSPTQTGHGQGRAAPPRAGATVSWPRAQPHLRPAPLRRRGPWRPRCPGRRPGARAAG